MHAIWLWQRRNFLIYRKLDLVPGGLKYQMNVYVLGGSFKVWNKVSPTSKKKNIERRGNEVLTLRSRTSIPFVIVKIAEVSIITGMR